MARGRRVFGEKRAAAPPKKKKKKNAPAKVWRDAAPAGAPVGVQKKYLGKAARALRQAGETGGILMARFQFRGV